MSNKILFFDTETTGLNPRVDKIRLFCYSIDSDRVEVLDAKSLDKESISSKIQSLLDSADRIVGFNIQFDMSFLFWNYGIPCHRYARKAFDLFLAAKAILNETSERMNLASVVKLFLNIELDKKLQKSDWSSSELSPEQIEYAKQDVSILRPLYEKIVPILKKENLLSVVIRDSAAAATVATCRPFTVDIRGWKEKLNSIQFPEWEFNSPGNNSLFDNVPPFNPLSHKQCIEYLRGLGISIDSSDKFARAKVQHPVIDYIEDYRKTAKLKQCFGDAYLTEFSKDGFLLPRLRIFGAASGRMSCSEPNIQQLPPMFRYYLLAPEGKKILKCDYSQIELRVLAVVSRDRQLIEAFRKKEDIHTKTAQSVLGSTDKEARKLAKALNFGLVYGMGATKFKDYLLANYDLDISLQDARRYIDRFFSIYRGVRAWLDSCKRPRYGFAVRTLSGRRRIFSNYESWPLCAAANTIIQGTAADGMLESLVRLADLFDSGIDLLTVVHDEFVLAVPDSCAEEAKQKVIDIMKEGMYSILKTREVPIEVSAEIARSWS